MFFNRRKKERIAFAASFGKTKTEGFNFEMIKRYYFNKDHTNAFQDISDQIANDLDLDLFFCLVDRTSSKIGQQFLYNKLRVIEEKDEQLALKETIIQYLNDHPSERIEIQRQLSKLNHQQAYYLVDLFQKELEEKPKWYFLVPLLSFTSILSLILSFFNPVLLIVLLTVFSINVFIHYGLKRKTNLFVNSIPALLTLGTIAQKLSKHSLFKELNPTKKSALKVIEAIRKKMTVFKLEQKIDSEIEAVYWYLMELIKITFLLEPLLMFSSIKSLQSKADEIEEVYQFVGEIDVLISIASMRSGIDSFCIPEISSDVQRFSFDELKHPLVVDCVANNLQIEKSILLTGSNMSGKSTFMRSIGLNYLSGLCLNTCFAKNALIPRAKLFTIMRIEDDLMLSSSYFLKEVSEMKNVLTQLSSHQQAIILLDELFKGTNTKERIAAAKAILSYLNKKNVRVLVATHDIELTELLKNEFDLYYFSESFTDSNYYYDYKLKPGIPKNGNAIRILELNQFPREIIQDANELLK